MPKHHTKKLARKQKRLNRFLAKLNRKLEKHNSLYEKEVARATSKYERSMNHTRKGKPKNAVKHAKSSERRSKKRKDRKKEHEGGKNLRSSEHVSHIALLQTYSSDDSYDSPAVYKGENRKQSNILAYFVGILLFAMVVGVFFYIFQQNKEKNLFSNQEPENKYHLFS